MKNNLLGIALSLAVLGIVLQVISIALRLNEPTQTEKCVARLKELQYESALGYEKLCSLVLGHDEIGK